MRHCPGRTKSQLFLLFTMSFTWSCVLDPMGVEVATDEEPATGEIASSSEAIFNGTIDYGDLNRNAVVWVNGCSGVLVAPDMVLTAGHCLQGIAPAWEDDPVVGRGTWRALKESVTVRVGPNPSSYLYETQASWVNSAGFDDIALLLLRDRVPSSLVRPVKVMNEAEYINWGGIANKTLYNPGFGSECSGWLSPRKYAYVAYLGGTPRGVNSFSGELLNYGGPQAYFEGGDSGSPLLWWNGAESRLYVVGVAVGWSGSAACTDSGRKYPHYIATFRTGAGDPAKPDLSAWLTAEVSQSLDRTSFRPYLAGDRWHDYFCVGDEICETGDFDNDGDDDIITFTLGSAGDVYVGKSYRYRTPTGSSVAQPGRGFESSRWHSDFGYNNEIVGVIDIDGDGKDDVFAGSPWYLWIARSTGSAFGTSYRANNSAICHPDSRTCVAGELRVGGGGEDLLSINHATGVLTVYRSDGTNLIQDTGFDTSRLTGLCTAPRVCKLADINNDGDDDVIIMSNDIYGHVDVSHNSGSSFGTPGRWVSDACFDFGGNVKTSCSLGDVDGDRLPDLVVAAPYASEVWVVRNGSSINEYPWHINLCGPGHVCKSADFNGDGVDDVVDFARSSSSATTGDVFVQTSVHLD